ncbi:MAG TPA: HAMP domain-containing sensor histidine kinase [Anaeromyxobacter sp.]|nr:HAMP domain-containing sensor histidine kinase [Anaeromyxobacter sp.]
MPRPARLLRYALAVALAAASLALAGVTSGVLGGAYLHFPLVAVFASGLLGGLGPGLVTLVLGWLGFDLLYVGPPMRLGVGSVEEAHRIIAFVLAGGIATWIAARFRTARHDAIEARRAAEAARDEASRVGSLQERLVAVVGHDLRNPLGALLGNLDILARSGPLTERQQLVAARMRGSVLRMEGMIRDLLDLARTRQGGLLAVSPVEVRLGEVCARAVSEIRDAHGGADVSLEVEGDDRARLDPERVAQLVTNLVGNALEHGAPGAPVRVRVVGAGADVVLVVENAGPTIPPELGDHLFEPFRRGTADGKGLGLGLFVVHEVTRAHGGGVTFRSAQGHTVFEVRLPRGATPGEHGPRRGHGGAAPTSSRASA